METPENTLSEAHLLREMVKSPRFYFIFLVLAGWGCALTGFSLPLAGLALFALLLAGLTDVDLRHMLLPDSLNYAGLATGILVWPFLLSGRFAFDGLWQVHFYNSLAGAFAGFLLFFAVFWIFLRLRGYAGMGFGDVKLLAMLGAWVGVVDLPLVLLLSCVLALPVFAVWRVFFGANAKTPLPYGPFLALGGWLAVLYGGLGGPLWHAIITFRHNLFAMISGAA